MTDLSTEATSADALLDDLRRHCYRPVLGDAQVGADDDFFALGADSIDLMRVVTAAQDHCRVDIDVAEFFEAPTLRRLAQIVERELAAGRVQAAS
ncbi:phosphopantetheine-binding protein [Kribbella flavida DSM 17836]|uniref:Phosphopantetheine-binding protein n=1 Tax=Kribbella flavida (strain DSM 17836 / JCM 10339 / NBRC 14399) TaxID=479435 RepID=D2PSM2_KRIFD|nr:phosphopantetheine-binding protein [Kribbella flavida]ADB33160.1 phosphopantetheine-binding protein [Kribbella flavida DSM 17836]